MDCFASITILKLVIGKIKDICSLYPILMINYNILTTDCLAVEGVVTTVVLGGDGVGGTVLMVPCILTTYFNALLMINQLINRLHINLSNDIVENYYFRVHAT